MKKWCERCNRYHEGEPVNENKIIEQHADALAGAIDKEVFDMMMRKAVIELAQRVKKLEDKVL